jgi:hypothetical protein
VSFRRRQERRESKYGHLLIPDDFPEAQRLPECRLRLEIPDSDYDGIERPLSGKLGKDVRYLVFLSCALDGFTCNRLQTSQSVIDILWGKEPGEDRTSQRNDSAVFDQLDGDAVRLLVERNAKTGRLVERYLT